MGLFPVERFIDETDTAVLMMLLDSSVPLQFEELTSRIAVIRKQAGIQPVLGNPELDADIVNSAIDDMLTVLERAGVIVQDQLEFSQERYRQRRVGGTVALTPFGTLMAVEQTRRSGLVVQTLDAASDLTAQRLAELAAAEMLEVEAWFSLVAQWVDEQADRVAAVRDLCEELTENEVIFSVLATELPDPLADDFATVLHHRMETHAPDDVLAAIAYRWLTTVGRLGPDETDPQREAFSELIILGFWLRSSRGRRSMRLPKSFRLRSSPRWSVTLRASCRPTSSRCWRRSVGTTRTRWSPRMPAVRCCGCAVGWRIFGHATGSGLCASTACARPCGFLFSCFVVPCLMLGVWTRMWGGAGFAVVRWGCVGCGGGCGEGQGVG